MCVNVYVCTCMYTNVRTHTNTPSNNFSTYIKKKFKYIVLIRITPLSKRPSLKIIFIIKAGSTGYPMHNKFPGEDQEVQNTFGA